MARRATAKSTGQVALTEQATRMLDGEPVPDQLHINSLLIGDEVIRFLNFKASEFLRNNSEAGRKLMLERLSQVEREGGATVGVS